MFWIEWAANGLFAVLSGFLVKTGLQRFGKPAFLDKLYTRIAFEKSIIIFARR